MRDVQVWVDPEYVISQLDEKDIMKIAEGMDFKPESREFAAMAINQIRAGRHEDAIVTLERAFLPRWKDKADCEQQYKLAMGKAA